MASLLTIPLELLVAVSTFLPTPDLASLRLTCNHLERSLYEWFSEEFFTKKQFMLTHPSLQTLVDISKHAGFSRRLQHVIIATNIYDATPLRFRDEEAAMRYTQGYESQRALLSTGLDREMLTEAFKNLPNLRTIGIRDFNAPSRIRDGKNASWTSWGATSVWKETGMHLSFCDRADYGTEVAGPFLGRVFSTVNHALGRAGRFPPEFEVLLRRSGLPDSAFSLPGFVLPIVEPVLRNLTTLLLNINLSTEHLFTHTRGTALDSHGGRSLFRFLSYTPNLSHLRLNFQKDLVDDNAHFLKWLSLPVPDTVPPPTNYLSPPPVSLPLLQTLELGQVRILPSTLLAVMAKFAPSLRSLSLWRMALYLDVPAPADGHKPNFWAELFRVMPQIPHFDLTHLKVGMVQQEHVRSTAIHVYFVAADDDGSGTRLTQVEHSGKDMAKFLDQLIKRAKLAWVEPAVVSEEDDDIEDQIEGYDDSFDEVDYDIDGDNE